MTTHLATPTGTACGLTFGGTGWGIGDEAITDPDEAGDCTCSPCTVAYS